MSFQMASHLLAIPHSNIDDKDLLAFLREQGHILDGKHEVSAVHFIMDNCSCTASLLETLQNENRPEAKEFLIWISDKPLPSKVKDLDNYGFSVSSISYRELREKLNFFAAPVLYVLKKGKSQYAGNCGRPGAGIFFRPDNYK